MQFIFFDGHSKHHFSKVFNYDEGLSYIDWDAIKIKQWKNDVDPDLTRRKQAECLVYKEVPLSLILGIGVFNEVALEKVQHKLNNFDCNIFTTIKKEWYY